MGKKLNAIHVGMSGFPFGNASINKCLTVYKLLDIQNVHVLCINNKALHSENIPVKIRKIGIYEDVSYQYTTPSPYRPESFLKRRYYNLIGRVNEFILLNKIAIKNKIDIMFYYPNGSFIEILYYRVLSKLYGFPLVSHYVEYRSVFKGNQNFWIRKNIIYFDKYFIKFVDGIFPISEFLIKHINERGFKGKYLKIPPLVDYNKFSDFQKNIQLKKYFLYAGDLVYLESINLILNAFKYIEDDDFDLYLVLKGSKSDMINMKEKISSHSKKRHIKIFTNLEYEHLLELFFGAKALLIPLNNRIQDVARFPHKIAEYTATGNPIISTNYGEVQYYFKDNVNALIAKNDDAFEFSEKMNFVCTHPEEAVKIGLKGYKTGLMYFDSNNYGTSIKHFIKDLIKN